MIDKKSIVTPTDVKKAQEDLYNRLRENPLLFGYAYARKQFRDESAPFHFKIYKEMQTHKKLAVAAPRGSAKSTILAFLKPVHSIVFKLKRNICIIAVNQEKANEKLTNITKFFKDSEDNIMGQFGLTFTKDTESVIQIKHPDKFETKISTFGRDQMPKVRGALFDAYRPDLIIIDDLEDDKQVENPDLRQEVRNHFEDSILKSFESSSSVECYVIGTILHDDCLIARLVSRNFYPDWRKLKYKALWKDKDGKYHSIWKDREGWNVPELLQERKLNPRTFAKEKQNDPVSGSNVIFRREDFRYWDILDDDYTQLENNNIFKRDSLVNCKGAIACDLAWSEKRTADDTVILGGLLTPISDILVYKFIAEKGMKPERFIEHLFQMEEQIRKITNSSVVVGFEKAMLERVYQSILKREMRNRNRFIAIKELKWESDKITRIETTLQPRFAQHAIFLRKDMGDLEHQLIRFPSATHDDIVDALHGLVKLLQYPKTPRKKVDETDSFMRLRQMMIDKKKNRMGLGRFGIGQKKRFEIPAHTCPI